ncbi:hypothetical protein [Tolumonas auensis]|uniref:hypothetical protein n=1 Tax=Tolumonas auensis TaxID=43948 RepID=UPI002AA5FDA5|nr:hypothetical protein [Tolumonas auensis]
MLFSEEFIKELGNDPINGALEICNKTIEKLDLEYHSEWSDQDFEYLAESYSILIELIDSKLLDIFIPHVQLTGSLSNICTNILQFITIIQQRCLESSSQLKIDTLRKKVRSSIGVGFHYEFTQGDLDIVQNNITALRELISASEHFEPEHQQRLLKRLEKLQSELHKKVSDLDRFWGLVGDAGVVLGKLGTDAKPFVDRIREIADVVWRTQSRAEELPGGTKLPVLSDQDTKADV